MTSGLLLGDWSVKKKKNNYCVLGRKVSSPASLNLPSNLVQGGF